MSYLTCGQLLKKKREARDLSARTLASLTGISQATLSRLENDKRPPYEREWAQLQQHLTLPEAPPPRLSLPSASPSWRVPAQRLSCSAGVTFTARAFRARQTFGQRWDLQMAKVESREDAELSWRFLNESGSDSGPEAMFWVLGLAAGCRARWYAPTKAGFRKFPIVDRSLKRKAAGDVRHPCLELKRPSYRMLLFPQVRVVTRYGLYVLDALALVRRGRRHLWMNVEIDGSGHEGERDQTRQEHLGLATSRIRASDLGLPDAFATLEQRLLEIFEANAR